MGGRRVALGGLAPQHGARDADRVRDPSERLHAGFADRSEREVATRADPEHDAARAGGASVVLGAARVAFWGALAMAVTAGVGKLFGTTVG